jgi:hypothetical protein
MEIRQHLISLRMNFFSDKTRILMEPTVLVVVRAKHVKNIASAHSKYLINVLLLTGVMMVLLVMVVMVAMMAMMAMMIMMVVMIMSDGDACNGGDDDDNVDGDNDGGDGENGSGGVMKGMMTMVMISPLVGLTSYCHL